MKPINLILVGLGSLAPRIVEFILERQKQFRLVGAVDPDPRKLGRDLGRACGLRKKLHIPIVADLDQGRWRDKPKLAILSTDLDLNRLAPQIEALAAAGLHVLATCEELSFPWLTAPALAHRLDTIAKRHQVTILAPGLNTGFITDLLPIALTAVCQRVDSIHVARVQNAALCHALFQEKMGLGLTVQDFAKKRQADLLRFAGLTESISMIATRMNWKLTKIENDLKPITARRLMRTKSITIGRGAVAGVQQIGRGFLNKEEKVRLLLRTVVAEAKPYDKLEIRGVPGLTMHIAGGIKDDAAAAAIVLNAISSVLSASAGLKTMIDIPVVSWFSA